MPTPPRRRPAAQPARRPRVAGLRKPGRDDTPDEPTREETPAAAPAVETPAARAETAGRHRSSRADSRPSAEAGEGTGPDRVSQEAAGTGVIGGKSDQGHENTLRDRPVAKPSGKRRSAGVSTITPTPRKVTHTKQKTSNSTLNLAIALAVAALLCAALGFWFKGRADRLTDGADRANAAFADPAATADVKSKISSAVERALSYDYTRLEATQQAVDEVLTGKAVCEYNAMFGQVKEVAPAQKLVLTTIVRELGVRYLDADRAEALVFIDQTSTRVEQGQTSASGAQLGVSAARVDGVWKITSFDTFDQPLPSGKTLPEC